MRLLRVFIALLAVAAGIANAQELRLDYERQSLTATWRHYTQVVDGLPVAGTEVIERVDRDGSVHEVQRVVARRSEPARRLIARSDAIAAVPQGAVAGAELVAVNIDGVARPSWRVEVEAAPHERYAHYVDAADGTLHRSIPLFFRATGRVFDPNPVVTLNAPQLRDRNDSAAAVPDAAYSEVDLPDLVPSGMLEGPNVKIVDVDTPSTTHADASQPLLFDRSQPQFEEVNAYFHIDRAQRYLQSLGYTGARRLVAYAVPVDPHAVQGADNSLYEAGSPVGRGTLLFGDGGTDDAEDADILLHEFSHVIQDWIAPGAFFGGSASEARALAEGIGDYWAYSSNYVKTISSGRDPYCLGDWDARCGGDDPSQNCGYPADADCLRRVDSPKTMADFEPIERAGQEHQNGEIWSSAMREIFDALVAEHGADAGRRLTDTVVLESLFGMPGGPTFAIAARKLLAADRAVDGGAEAAVICRAMTVRGILSITDCDSAPHGELTWVQAPQQGLAIPDDSSSGISSSLTISDPRSVDRVYVNVDIEHPRRGDLQIVLTAPDGTAVILQNPSLDRSAAAPVTYGLDAAPVGPLVALAGRPATGTWTLTVRDLTPESTGILRSWSLLLVYAGDAPATRRPFSLVPRVHIPIVAHVTGIGGSEFVSDVRIFNRGSAAANVTAVFTPDGANGWERFAAVKLVLAPQQVVAWNDVVRSTMQSTGAGALEILGDTADLVVASRMYTSVDVGTSGQFIPSATTTAGAGIGTNLVVGALRDDASYRSNAGFTEVGGEAGTIHVRVTDGTTAGVIEERDIAIAPFGHVQFPVRGSRLMIVEFSVAAGNARILAYGSVIDNLSGDAFYVPARAASGEVAFAPVVSSGGVAGTRWRTTLCFSSTLSEGPVPVRFTYAGGTFAGVVAVGLGRVSCLDDAVPALTGLRDTLGVVRAQLPPGSVATTRIWTGESTGSYGQFVPFLPADAALSAGDILFVDQNDDFRTNVGVINPQSTAATVRLTAYDAEGNAVGAIERIVAPMQMDQIPVASFAGQRLSNGRVHVSAENGRVLAYGSLVDNHTGDASYVPAQ